MARHSFNGVLLRTDQCAGQSQCQLAIVRDLTGGDRQGSSSLQSERVINVIGGRNTAQKLQARAHCIADQCAKEGALGGR